MLNWQYEIENVIYLFLLMIQKHVWKGQSEVWIEKICSHIIAVWPQKEQSFVVEGHCECNVLSYKFVPYI
jgi:hypothetical protein